LEIVARKSSGQNQRDWIKENHNEWQNARRHPGSGLETRPEFKLGAKDIEGRQSYLGSLVWRNPRLELREYDIPTPGPIRYCSKSRLAASCGSDVHMAQQDKNGYIYYPGLTGFPSILGHEFSGVVIEAGKNAFDKRTNKPFKGGERVTSEEMLWCASCRPCADGQPNHCERLDEVGFNVTARMPSTWSCLRARSGAWNPWLNAIRE